MLWYSITIDNGIMTVKNTASPDNISVTLVIQDSCTSEKSSLVQSKLILYPGDSTDIKLPMRDGLYLAKLERLDSFTNVIKETGEESFPYFEMLLQSIIKDTKYFLCGCTCKDCDECNQDEKTALSILLKSFSYYTLMYKYYTRFYDAVFKCLNCSIIDVTSCVIINEKVLGKTENNQLFEKMISSLYLAIYFGEYYSSSDKDAVDQKFKYNKIIKCIKNNDTDIDCIKNNIENNMGIFSIQFGAYVNRPPSVVGNYNAGTQTNQATLVLTPGMFTTLTTPVYADPENDPAQAIRIDSLPTNGVILKLSTTNVTTGQIITIADISSGLLTITGPNQVALVNSTFNFSVRDTGSMQFTS